MKNYLGDGNTVTVTAPEVVDSGEFIKVGVLFGVAVTAAANGADVPLLRRGVFELPKDAAAAWVQGDQLYWDAAAKAFTKTSAGNTLVGVAFAAAAQADVVGQVSLDR